MNIEELLQGMLCATDQDKTPTVVVDERLNRAYLNSILKRNKETEDALQVEVKRLFPEANRVFIRPPNREDLERTTRAISSPAGVAGFRPNTIGTSS